MKPLSSEELNSIYENIIKPNLFNRIESSTEKTCIYLGGQPGAGKSYLNDISINSLSNKSAVVIDSDLLRRHHPYTPLIPEKDIYSLDQDCYKWGDMLVKDSLKENKNVIFDGTFGGSIEHAKKLIELFKSNGYSTKLNLLATNDVVSTIGFNWRYASQKHSIGIGRPVDLSYHNQIYDRIPENLRNVFQHDLFDEFCVYGRDHVSKEINLYTRFNALQLKSDPGKAITSYENERVREFRREEVAELKSWFNKTCKLIEANKGDLDAFKQSVQTRDLNAKINLKEQIKWITNIPLNLSSKQTVIIKGNLGQDPVLQTLHNGAKVASFSIGIKGDNNKVEWQGVQVWKEDIEKFKISTLKKGDFVELKGQYGKEYINSNGETKRDFILNNCQVLKRANRENNNKGFKI